MLESLLGFCKIIVLAAIPIAALPYYFTLFSFSFPLFSSQGTGKLFLRKSLLLFLLKAFLAASRSRPRSLPSVSGMRPPRPAPAQPVVGSMWTSPLERFRSCFLWSGILPRLPSFNGLGGLKWTRTTDLTLIRRAL